MLSLCIVMKKILLLFSLRTPPGCTLRNFMCTLNYTKNIFERMASFCMLKFVSICLFSITTNKPIVMLIVSYTNCLCTGEAAACVHLFFPLIPGCHLLGNNAALMLHVNNKQRATMHNLASHWLDRRGWETRRWWNGNKSQWFDRFSHWEVC